MEKLKFYHVLVVLSIILCLGCSIDDIEINDVDDFESFLADEIEYQNIPAMSVLIFREETVLYEKYFGYSNIRQNISLADNHLFLLASISKVVTATALLQLYDHGHFDLDDTINDYLPFNVHVPDYSNEITFRMLLTHTSGIADNDAVLDGQYYYNQDPQISLSYFIENYLAPGGEFYDPHENYFDFEPGSNHEYSNIGSALIGVLVEKISGVDFNTYCKDNIFIPLEMNNTSWRLDEITQTIVTPYDYVHGQYQAIEHYTFTDFPNGGLRATARDMFTFASTLVKGGQTGRYRLLNNATVHAMMTPQIPTIDNETGLHLFIMDNQNNLWGHDGGEQGAATIMAFNPTTKIGAIILTNQGEADLDEILVNAYQLGLIL